MVPNLDTRPLTMAQALVLYLRAQFTDRDGVETRLFSGMLGIFGHGNVAGLGQALIEYGSEFPFYQPRNEQSMVHTAIGYAKAMRRRATLACTSSIGPGSTNMITGAATATINRIPVLLLPSDYYATRHQGPVLQQLEHPIDFDLSVNDCFRPVSRYFDRISRPEQLGATLTEAMSVLTDAAETGAVTISLPQDVQSEAYDYPTRLFDKRVWRLERRAPDSQAIEDAVALLAGAERPMIIAGGGVHYSEASEELQSFAEEFGVPVGETFGGKGAISGRSPMLLGGVGVTGTAAAGQVMRESDLVICVGTRLADFTTGSRSAFQNPRVRFVSINVNPRDANKLAALRIVADARVALAELSRASREAGLRPAPAYTSEVETATRSWRDQVQNDLASQAPDEPMTQSRLISVLNDEARAGDTVLAAAGTPPADLHKLWDTGNGSSCHLEFGNSCMGYEIPASLGVRMAQPEGEIYALVGDGTYLMNPTELVTAMQERLKITVVISENHGFQSIHALQKAKTGHSFATEFRARDATTGGLGGEYLTIDFAKNAESMGAKAWHVTTEEDLVKALQKARNETRPCVIVVETAPYRSPPGADVWWDVAPAEVSSDPIAEDRRGEYDKEREQQQRFYG